MSPLCRFLSGQPAGIDQDLAVVDEGHSVGQQEDEQGHDYHKADDTVGGGVHWHVVQNEAEANDQDDSLGRRHHPRPPGRVGRQSLLV